MEKKFTLTTSQRLPRPRSKRLREQGIGSISGAIVIGSAGTGVPQHVHPENVQKSGDTMTGDLTMANGTAIKIGEAVLSWDAEKQGLRVSTGMYSDFYVSAFGKNDTEDSTTGATFDLLQSWDRYNASTAQQTALSAYLGKDLDLRVAQLESGSATKELLNSYYTKTEIDLKGFATITALTDTLSTKADKATTLAGYGIADAYTKTQTDSTISAAVNTAKTTLETSLDQVATALQGQLDGLALKNQFDELFAEYMNADTISADLITANTLSGSLAWSYITSKPTTLSGYGITDAYTKTQTDTKLSNKADKATTLSGYGITDGVNTLSTSGSGNAVTGASISGHTMTVTLGKTFLEKATFDDLFEKVNIGTSAAPKYAVRVKYGLYSDDFVSSFGKNDTASSGAGAGVELLQDWNQYANSTAKQTALSAFLGKELKDTLDNAVSRLSTLEGGSAMNINVTGTGNAVTSVSKDGTMLTFTKGTTFLTEHQSLSAYATTSAMNTAIGNAKTTLENSLDSVAASLQGQLNSLALRNQFDEVMAEYMNADTISADIITANTLTGALGWSYITDRPTTLGGYGITDGAKQADLTAEVTRAKAAESANATAAANANANANTRVLKAGDTMTGTLTMSNGAKIKIGEAEISYDTANGCLRFSKGIYSDSFVSSFGKNDAAGGGGGSVANLLQSWNTSVSDADAKGSWALSAYLGKELNTRLSSVESGKVDKVSGKRLSTNDFTTALLTKLNGIEAGANNYTLTKAAIEGLLTGNITSHTHNQYLTQHQSLSAYATTSTMNTAIGNAKTTLENSLDSVATSLQGQLSSLALRNQFDEVFAEYMNADTISADLITANTLSGSLAWSYLTSKPTTLSGYGITDQVIKEGDSRLTDARKCPTALSWSGYSSGSYDGSAAKSFVIPSKTSQIAEETNLYYTDSRVLARVDNLFASVQGQLDGLNHKNQFDEVITEYVNADTASLDILTANTATIGAAGFTTMTSGTATITTLSASTAKVGTLTADTAIIIGNVKLTYDSANNAIRISKTDGGAMNLVATGGVTCLA